MTGVLIPQVKDHCLYVPNNYDEINASGSITCSFYTTLIPNVTFFVQKDKIYETPIGKTILEHTKENSKGDTGSDNALMSAAYRKFRGSVLTESIQVEQNGIQMYHKDLNPGNIGLVTNEDGTQSLVVIDFDKAGGGGFLSLMPGGKRTRRSKKRSRRRSRKSRRRKSRKSRRRRSGKRRFVR